MKILVLKHATVEHPGVFRNFLEEDGHHWDAVEMHLGETPPPIDNYDALWAMGGPMDVWQEDAHPWLVTEKAYIRDAVEAKGAPFFGLCLGHQLLADALGGRTGKAETPEIGVMPVRQTELGTESVFLDGTPIAFDCLQWHGAEVVALPDGAKVLASSPACVVQAMSWGPRAFSAQFHVEVEADTVRNWAEIPEYRAALDASFGEGGVERLERDCAEKMAEFNSVAERMYINWMQAAAQA